MFYKYRYFLVARVMGSYPLLVLVDCTLILVNIKLAVDKKLAKIGIPNTMSTRKP